MNGPPASRRWGPFCHTLHLSHTDGIQTLTLDSAEDTLNRMP